MPVDEGGHPEAEDLAAFVEGVLPADERNDLELHLLKCADCRDVVAETAAIVAGNGTALGIRAGRRNLVPFRWSRRAGVATSLAAAAALAGLMVGGVWIASHTGGTGRRLELQELVAAVAKEPVRPVTGRLTGGFRYAPPPPTRSTSPREISPDVRIAAAKLERLAYDHATPINQGALGVAYLAIGDLSKAVRELERASAEAPENAGIQNDLSAAYLASSCRYGGTVRRSVKGPRRCRTGDSSGPQPPRGVFQQSDRARAFESRCRACTCRQRLCGPRARRSVDS